MGFLATLALAFTGKRLTYRVWSVRLQFVDTGF